MRWDELFADIESQLEQERDAERLEVAVEEERLRLGRLALRDRIAGMAGADRALGVVVGDGERVDVRVDAVGRDWFAGEVSRGAEADAQAPRRSIVIPVLAVSALIPSGDQLAQGLRPASGATELSAQLGLAFVLRDLCRRRVPIDLATRAGSCHGTIDRVGRDHLDLAEHERGEARRERVVRRIRIVPFEAIVHIRF